MESGSERKGRGVLSIWAMLAAPAVWLVLENLILDVPGGKFFRWTGILGMAFVLAALAATPIRRLFPGAPAGVWLIRQRRYVGVAGFAYSALHTAYWLRGADVEKVLHSFARPEVLPGWIGLLILSWMALTSNDTSVRRLGPRWKALQRWIYLGAPIAMLHWLLCAEQALATPLVFAVALSSILIARLGTSLSRARR